MLIAGLTTFVLMASAQGQVSNESIASNVVVNLSGELNNRQEIRSAPKRLRDYNLPGLERNVPDFNALKPMDVVQLIEYLAHIGGLKNIVISTDVTGLTAKLRFSNVTVGDALEVVLSANYLAYEVKDGILQIMTDEAYQKFYGTSFYDNKKVEVIKLEYADTTRLLPLVESVKSSIGTVVSDQMTGTFILIDTPEKIAEMKAIIVESDISTISRVFPTVTKTFVLQYAELAEIQAHITPLINQAAGSIHADERSRTMIVTDLPHNMAKIANIIEIFDKRPQEVFIEAKIVQVNLSEEWKLGINWHHLFQGIDPRYAANISVVPPLASPLGSVNAPGSGYGSVTYNTIMGGTDLTVILDAIKTIGDMKILSNPHVTVLDGQEASIETVRDQPYAEADFESGSTNVIGESIAFIPVGVTLHVTPRINNEGFITVDIKPSVSTVDGFYNAMYPIPIVQKAEASTSVMVKDGETIIIAGMIEEATRTLQNSVPFLSRIPLLGLMFRSESEIQETKETIVFLTPRIIGGDEPIQLLRDVKKEPKPLRSVDSRTEKPAKAVR